MLSYPVASHSLTTTTGATGHPPSFVKAIQCTPQVRYGTHCYIEHLLATTQAWSDSQEIPRQAQAVATNVDNVVASRVVATRRQHTQSEKTAPLPDVKLDWA